MADYRQKLQELLRELFQFDCADLDFGIYRIINHKRDAIERFIQEDLIEAVSAELSSGVLQQQSQDAAALQQVAKQIREVMGASALDGDGKLAEAYHNTPLGQRYLDLQARAAGARVQSALEAIIFNHLYAFFSRYYDNGDFISKRRYSKREKYAIPYNGEEVYLHWANKDQYYVKTGEYFTDYRFKSHGLTVHFRLRNAAIEKDNNKGEKRFFVPAVEDAVFDAGAEEIVIPFEFRPLTGQENEIFGSRNAQGALIAAALEEVPKHFRQNTQALGALLAVHHKNAEGREISFLEHHLSQYTRRNTSDFFIHKDLKGFLERELDFYLKNEVLNLDELGAAGETRAEGWFQIMRVIRAIGMRIIEFLAQIEDFQKKLYEKKKFVTETQYCITMVNIPEEFYGEIADNEAQWEEWKDLYHLDEERRDLFTSAVNDHKERRIVILKAHPTLVLDTKHFSADFVDKLLAGFSDLDDIIDGLLIYGENFQAINLLMEKYNNKIKCIYLDPPYNTDAGPILYKNDLKSSSWMSMMAERLKIAKKLLNNNGILCITIDDYQQKELHFLIEREFGPYNIAGTVVIRNNPSGRPVPSGFAQSHEYAIFVTKTPDATIAKLPRSEDQAARYRHLDENGSFMWELFRKRGSNSERRNRPSLYYPIYVLGESVRVPEMKWDDENRTWNILEDPLANEIVVYPIDELGTERTWRGKPDDISANPDRYRAKQEDGNVTIYYKFRPKSEGVLPLTIWVDAKYSATEHGTGFLKKYFSEYNIFSYPKSIYAVEDSLRVSGIIEEDDAIVCDFFAGSGTTGHAVINLNRQEYSRYRFILVEMADYFYTVLLPRIKKAIFSPEWEEGRPLRQMTVEEAMLSPRLIKYIQIESYEDALNNIAFSNTAGQKLLEFDDYLLKYMLDWETRGSATLLNVEMLASPFSYELTLIEGQETKRKRVDIPETFNYLLGLHVRRRLVYNDGDRRYLVYRGELDRRQIAVIWRETKGWGQEEYERDKRFVAEQKMTEGADEIFVNGDSFIPGARALEPIFKSRMFGGV